MESCSIDRDRSESGSTGIVRIPVAEKSSKVKHEGSIGRESIGLKPQLSFFNESGRAGRLISWFFMQ
jgi:hypothetical protein